MPNRILREGILTSERVESLSWQAEVFYRRLMSVVDDYGRFHAKPALIRAACFPLRLDRVSDSDIGKWIRETEEAGLVRAYQVEGKGYLELLDFGQQIRAKESRFPGMRSTCLADAQQARSERMAYAPVVVDVDVVVDEDGVGQRASPENGDGAGRTEPVANKSKNGHVRATRLPADWRLPEEWRRWADEAHGVDGQRATRMSLAFRDYWIGKPGRDGTKLDWAATWRNWVRKECGDA